MPQGISGRTALFSWIYRHSFISALSWIAVITILCATPGQYIPSNNWLELLSVDKLVHASIFFTLAVLLFIHALKRRHQLAAYFLFTVFYGILMELMQAYCFSNRSADWKDVLANTVGAISSLFVLKKLRRMTTLPDR